MNRHEVDRIKSMRDAMREGRVLVSDSVYDHFKYLYKRVESFLTTSDVDLEGMVREGLMPIDAVRQAEEEIGELLFLCDEIGARR